MLEKVNAVINLFRKGSEVSNVEAWKNRGISVAALAAAMGALAQFGDAFGIHVAITPEQLNGLAVGIVTLVGIVLPVITSKRAGLLPAKASQHAPIEDHSFSDGVPAISASVATGEVQHQPQSAMADSDNPLAGLDTTFRG
ncbi:hypothetical protein UNDKW_3643 [Undibacterium sp. KW1]|uniref:hypothetical protein n=1 Tax=Undibacterium sp. KW1 TaxID=2058624 RepID=UPI001331E6AB|nr:hypothetical protein [Undibacterium sp. KW1]BBB61916.1 hypothetical protein UNDKW_3643 [Undibacterium sp. KW1]